MSEALRKAPDDARPLDDAVAAARSRAVLQHVDLGDWSILVDPTAEDLAAIYADGARSALELVGFANGDETTNEVRAQHGLDPVHGGDDVPDIVNQVNERSVAWASDHAAELVSQISENTRDMLHSTVVQAITEGWGTGRLADEIEQSAGFSQSRAETISRTERSIAQNRGNLDAYKESGVVNGKSWATANDDLVDDECQENEDEGPIPLDEAFPSGDDSPPGHANCRCALIPELLEE